MASIFSIIIWGVIYSVSYFALLFLFPYFFEGRKFSIGSSKKSLRSVGIILSLVLVFFVFMYNIPDPIISNRVEHALCGGFLAFVICFLAARDSKVRINKFQFFLFSALLVTALGVGNEIAEFIVQNTTSLVMSSYINDTWLDLISNTTGLLVAAAFLTPCHRK